MIGKFGIAASFGIIFLYASELLPTVVRSQAMAIASFVAGIGLIAFPYIVFLVSINLPISFAKFWSFRIKDSCLKSNNFLILGSLFSSVTLADYGFVSHSRSSLLGFIARDVGSEPATNFGRRRSFWLAVSDLELSCRKQKVISHLYTYITIIIMRIF